MPRRAGGLKKQRHSCIHRRQGWRSPFDATLRNGSLETFLERAQSVKITWRTRVAPRRDPRGHVCPLNTWDVIALSLEWSEEIQRDCHFELFVFAFSLCPAIPSTPTRPFRSLIKPPADALLDPAAFAHSLGNNLEVALKNVFVMPCCASFTYL